ncbi:hypothetical protein MKX08_010527 [Trichoderma sp. CBMAI-0020]|nr:hypothetical protein MKX08_010527 [Trichoderma sp. CBMAI-0020]
MLTRGMHKIWDRAPIAAYNRISPRTAHPRKDLILLRPTNCTLPVLSHPGAESSASCRCRRSWWLGSLFVELASLSFRKQGGPERIVTCGETSAKLLPDVSRNHRFGVVSSAIPVAAPFRGCSAMCIGWWPNPTAWQWPAEGSDVDTYPSEGLLVL